MGILGRLFGEFRWTPPGWLKRIGARRFGLGILTAVLLAALAGGAIHYYRSLPKPAQVVATVTAPGVTPVVDGELRPEPLSLQFSVEADPRVPVDVVESVARLDQVGEVVEEGVSIDPAMDGEWRWASETELRFSPAADWPAGRRYTVRYDQSLFAPNLEFSATEAEFETAAFTAEIRNLEFYQDPVEQDVRKVVATVGFSHPVDPDSLAERLSYRMRASGETIDANARNVELDIRYDPLAREAYVHSVPIDIPPEENYLTLRIEKGLAPARGPSRLEEELLDHVRIPDISSYFRVTAAQSVIARNEDDEPVQTLTIHFTDRVETERLQQRVSAWLLPANVIVNGRELRRRNWQSPREVTADVLQKSQNLDLQLSPVEGDSAALHGAVMDVPENRFVYLKIDEGLTSDGGFVLSRAYDTLVRAPVYPKEATIAQSGAVLPLSSSHRLTFISRGVSTLKVELGRLLDDDVNHLASQTGGDIRNPRFNNYLFDQDNISARVTRFIDLNEAHPRTSVYSSLDLSEYLPDGGYYFVSVQGWDEQNERPIGTADRRFVLVTDIGLLVKTSADNSHDIFVHSIGSGEPIAGASVALLGKNGVPILERRTSSDGHASMPATDGFDREQAPTVFVVRNGADSIFMPYARHGRMLQYSRFDTGGEYRQQGPEDERLRAQVFTDRGLYRPGDAVKIAAIVKRDDWGPLGNVPLSLRIVDARGQLVLKKDRRLPDDGFFDDEFRTEAASSTGNYNATLLLADERGRERAIGGTVFKVEEFLPDRLRIDSEIRGQKATGWLKPGDLVCDVRLENLFGTPAQSRRVRGRLDLTPTSIRIEAFGDYVFRDPLRERRAALQPISEPLADTITDENGHAELPLDLSRYDKGIYRLNVLAEGFEEGGGRSVTALASVMMSPLDYLIGYKATSDPGLLSKDSDHAVDFIAVNSDGKAIDLDALTLSITEYRYVSTLVQRPDGAFAYQSVRKETPVSKRDYAITRDGSRYQLPTTEPGNFAVVVADVDGRVFSKVDFTVAGARNLAGNLERDAELELKIDGDNFAAGDEIRLEITAPYTGTGLITIERDRVYAHKWIRSDTNTSVHSIRVPEGLEGNAYVNVAFVRELDSPEIYVSPLSYAVAPFSIDREARTIRIDLDAPELVRPGEDLVISHATSERSRIVVYAVDEGILQVARYRMPQPLDHFLPKMALQVASYQMVDLILPDFDRYRQEAAPGGGDVAALLGSNLNPFRRKTDAPVVFWSGIVDSGPDGDSVTYRVPDYFNGQLRVMAVAVAETAVGHRETTTVARAPFVITPNVLTAAAPGDEFEINVGVSNNLEGSGEGTEIGLSVTSSENLAIVGDDSVMLAIDEGGEDRARFRVRVLDELGPASVAFKAVHGSETARSRATLSVRPSVAYVATMQSGASDDDPIELGFPRTMFDEFSRQHVAASASPLVLADGLLDYLDAFPHACAEQIVSKVFPQLGFLGHGDADVDEAAVRNLFASTATTLRSRQGSEGGFRFWATSTEPARFPSVYIMHFFTDAAELGLPVPRDMRDAGLDYLRGIAAEQVQSLPDARLRAYAIYVLTRNGTVTTNYLTNLHEYLDRAHAKEWRRDLAAAYMGASYALLKQTGLGDSLAGDYEFGAGEEMRSDFDTRLGRDAQYLYLLARHFPERLARVDAATVEHLTGPVMRNRFNTLSSAYTILALGEYTRAIFEQGDAALGISVRDDDGVRRLVDAARFARTEVENSIRDVRIGNPGGNDVYYVLSQTGFDRSPPQEALAEGLEIHREYLDEDGDAVTEATIGDDLTVRLRIRSTGRPRTNVAVVDLLPGGFEVDTDSVQRPFGGWTADYVDVREDRVVVYGSFGDRLTEIRYRVKVTSAGNFVLPSAFAGSMYDRSVQARTAPGRFEVEAIQ